MKRYVSVPDTVNIEHLGILISILSDHKSRMVIWNPSGFLILSVADIVMPYICMRSIKGAGTLHDEETLYLWTEQVLKEYPIAAEALSIVHNEPLKSVYKVKTGDRMLGLKQLDCHHYDRLFFSLSAYDHIYKMGGNIPYIVKTRSNDLVVQKGHHLFFLHEWLHGKKPDFSRDSHLLEAMKGLAKFHSSSKGHEIPLDLENASGHTELAKEYARIKATLQEWKDASKNISLPYHREYLKHADSILEICDIAIELLSNSYFTRYGHTEWTSSVLSPRSLESAIITEKGLHIVDLEDMGFLLPSDGIRKILGKHADNNNEWRWENISYLVNSYIGINPLDAYELYLLYIDLLFPHCFFYLVKNLFENNRPIRPSDISRMARLEHSKLNLLGFLYH